MTLLLIARGYAFHGGVERATAGLLGTLAEHGYAVHLLTDGGPPPVKGVRLHRLRLPPLPAAARLVLFVAATRRFLRRGQWDVVQSHERTLGQHIYRAGEGCHRAYLDTRDTPTARGLYHRLVLALERRVFARTPQLVAIARMGKREIEHLYGVAPERVSVVYNGVDLERFHPGRRAALRSPARSEAAIPDGSWTVLFVGSGFERKGLGTALEAFAAFADHGSRLIVIGKGDTSAYRAQAGRLGVGDRVRWLGPRPDMERWYAAADVVLQPSRYEPFGNVHLEALASGLPVVTSTRAGGSELIVEGANGSVVDPRDARAAARGLAWLRDLSPTGVIRVAEAARRAAEPFSYPAQVAGFARIYANFP